MTGQCTFVRTIKTVKKTLTLPSKLNTTASSGVHPDGSITQGNITVTATCTLFGNSSAVGGEIASQIDGTNGDTSYVNYLEAGGALIQGTQPFQYDGTNRQSVDSGNIPNVLYASATTNSYANSSGAWWLMAGHAYFDIAGWQDTTEDNVSQQF